MVTPAATLQAAPAIRVPVPLADPPTAAGGTGGRPPTAAQKRAAQPAFVELWSLDALRPLLPLRFPVDPGLPPSPKTRYRSQYQPPDPAALAGVELATLSDFDLALHLIDFSPLERALATMYQPSHKGQVAFHPVSMFLAISLRREQALSWQETADLLASEHGAGWRVRFGFRAGETPSASGLRYVAQVIDPDLVADLCPRSIALLRAAGLFPTHSTYPGDPPNRGVSVCQDGMLHFAHQQDTCWWATDECFAPLRPPAQGPAAGNAPAAPPAEAVLPGAAAPVERHRTGAGDPAGDVGTAEAVPPGAAAPPPAPAPPPTGTPPAPSPPAPPPSPGSPAATGTRPCRARAKGWPGCACATPACQAQCCRASRLDPDARFIHYAGHNRPTATAASSTPSTRPRRGNGPPSPRPGATADPPAPPARPGVDLFGYRSIAERVLDDRFAAAWTLDSMGYAANTDERTVFAERVARLRRRFPDLAIGEWLDDAAVGYGECLDTIWHLGALRLIELRADPSDADPATWVRRGYDAHGHPLCPHGYPLHSNGYDAERRRTKWVCAQACRRQPRQRDGPIEPVTGCPYLDAAHPLGFCANVGRTMPDGSLRLAREIPYGSATWKARYGRRNLAESRNAQLEEMRLKHLPVCGLPRVIKEVQLADFVVNLRTIGRLVREATRQARA